MELRPPYWAIHLPRRALSDNQRNQQRGQLIFIRILLRRRRRRCRHKK